MPQFIEATTADCDTDCATGTGFAREKSFLPAKVPPRSGRSVGVESPNVMLAAPPTTMPATLWPVRMDVLGVEVSVTSYDELCRLFIAAARRNEPALASFLPVHGVVTAAMDKGYQYVINAFDVVAPDGQPVRWALNWLHKVNLSDRVSGPHLMLRLCARAAIEGVGIYLYGSTDDTLKKLAANLKDLFPAIRIVGVESPPFRPLTREENDSVIDRINDSGAGLVFIGLGLPRQDFFAHQNRHRIKAVQLCVGAAFDFHAGKKKLAPVWMQNTGLEWTYRLLQEPRRLWKRYLVTNTMFVYLMTRRLLRGA
jgi:exopolysaccharide biosynthesis WecB/TagA/CpsF family protein